MRWRQAYWGRSQKAEAGRPMKQSQDCRGRCYSVGGLKRDGVKVRTAVTSEAKTGVLGAWLKGHRPLSGRKPSGGAKPLRTERAWIVGGIRTSVTSEAWPGCQGQGQCFCGLKRVGPRGALLEQ